MTVPGWRPGDNVRGTEVREVVGGKGNNVARALRKLGRSARPVTFLGGAVGQRCEALFRAEPDLDPILVATLAATREIITVRSPGVASTAFFDPDPAITDGEADTLFRRVEAELALGEVEAITLSGSSPSRSTHHLYSDLIAMAQAREVPTFLDTYGPSLEAIWGFWPDVINLNRREIGLLLRRDDPSDDEIYRLLKQWSRRGVKVATVTDGPDDILAQVFGQFFWVEPPEVDPVNPIGSGDCLLAGLVDAHLAGLDAEATLRRAVATAVANAQVWDAGGFDPEAVRRLEPEVLVEPAEF